MKQIFRTLLLILSLSAAVPSQAQDFSYVYIQGDKKVPLYVKVEGEMMPRYGKNYALLSRLAPGPLNIDILFRQNEYPPLHFTILVPEHGRRAFLVNKKGDAFSLYDLEQRFDLKPNNDISEDHLPVVIDNKTLAEHHQPERPASPAPEETAEDAAQGKIKVWEDPAEPAVEKAGKKKAAKQNTEPEFIGNIAFDNQQAAAGTVPAPAAPTAPDNTSAAGSTEISNSDCKGQISSSSFQHLYNIVNTRKTEDERLGLFLESLKQNCFTTEMTAKIVALLNSDAARYSALKHAYPKITDQSKFRDLGELLSEAEWKEYFNDMVQP